MYFNNFSFIYSFYSKLFTKYSFILIYAGFKFFTIYYGIKIVKMNKYGKLLQYIVIIIDIEINENSNENLR